MSDNPQTSYLLSSVFSPGREMYRNRIIFEGLGLSVSPKGIMSNGALIFASIAKCDTATKKWTWFVNLHTGYWLKSNGCFLGHGWFPLQQLQEATVHELYSRPSKYS